MGLSRSFTCLVVSAIGAPLTFLACGPGWTEPTFTGTDEAGTAKGGDGDGGGAPGCDVPAKLEAVSDPSKLPACCAEQGGKAHCLAKAKSTQRIRDTMAPCPDDAYCVPDNVLKSGGGKPKTCQSQYGEGACRSICVPAVAEKKNLLKQGECDPDEVCVPCINPLDKKPSGACPTAEDDKKAEDAAKNCAKPGTPGTPTTDGGAQPEKKTCCATKGTCIATSSVPPERQDNLNSNDCEQDQKCVPIEMIDPNFKPQKCNASFLAGGGPGVCLSKCLQFDFLTSLGLWQQECDEDHVCAPCQQNGKPSGAPGCQ
jgi:hypothetical protein